MMAFEPVDVNARWKHDGKFEPTQFYWKKKMYHVDSTGRDWEDSEGFHVLCMVEGQVYELIFKLKPAGWLLKPPANTPKVV